MNRCGSLIVVYGVLAGWIPLCGCRSAAVESLESAGAKTSPISVEVLTATENAQPRSTTQPATVHAYFEARVFAKVSGYLAELKADIGQTVKANDVLAVIAVPELSSRREAKLARIRQMEAEQRRAASELAVSKAGVASFRAKLDQSKAEVGKATAALQAAQVELQRAHDLVQQKAVADRLYDEAQKKHAAAKAEQTAAQAAVASAEAELTLATAKNEAAQADLDVAKAATDVARRELEELDALLKYTQLTAPFDGVVTARNVDPGDLVRDVQTGGGSHSSPLFVVTQLDRVRVRVAVPERDSPLASVGDAAKISLQALPKQEFEGKISRVAGVLDEQTRTMLVEIDLPNPDRRIRPGMFGQATIVLAAPGDSLTLPASAVRFDEDGNSYVYVVNAADEVEVAPVETGMDDGESIEIVAGLTGRERIVGPLLRRLTAGQRVAVKG